MKLSVEKFRQQQKQILESLKYASYIQQALLPSEKDLLKVFPESFVFYRPRDIVSGDFYYVARKKETVILAVADCTGHGVPGAFMSILGITCLDDIVRNHNIFSAGSVLNNLRERIMKALCQKGEDFEQKDGIDMSLCIINPETGKMNFAGAFNSIYVVRDKQLFEMHGDNMPVGVAADEEKSFSSHFFDLKNDDLIYLFTDGYVDQFGGPYGKKLKYNRLKEFILSINSVAPGLQKKHFEDMFDAWKGNLNQLDDVLILGCKFQTL